MFGKQERAFLTARRTQIKPFTREGPGVLTNCYNLPLIRRLTNQIEKSRKPLNFAYKGVRERGNGTKCDK